MRLSLSLLLGLVATFPALAQNSNVKTPVLGFVFVNAAGTIIPQVTFSAGPTGTCEVALDSFFEIWVTGPNAVNYVGDWS